MQNAFTGAATQLRKEPPAPKSLSRIRGGPKQIAFLRETLRLLSVSFAVIFMGQSKSTFTELMYGKPDDLLQPIESGRLTSEIRLMTENEISEQINGLAIKVHRKLGPGLLESAYEHCLFYELSKSGLKVERQRPVVLVYEEIILDCVYKLDIIVEDKVIVETKSVKEITDIDQSQLLTHLKLSNCKLGLLINFYVLLLKQGIRRIVNNL